VQSHTPWSSASSTASLLLLIGVSMAVLVGSGLARAPERTSRRGGGGSACGGGAAAGGGGDAEAALLLGGDSEGDD